MSSEPQDAFAEIIRAYETWRDKPGLSRQQRSAALTALASFIHAMGWTSAVQDELKEGSRRK
jgi:hypothetical protein